MAALMGYENPANTVTSTLGIIQLLAQVPGCMMPTASLTKSYLWSLSCPPHVSCEAQVTGSMDSHQAYTAGFPSCVLALCLLANKYLINARM